MPFNPEGIEVALFNILKTAGANAGQFPTISRVAQIFSGKLGQMDQPALFLVPLGGEISPEKGMYGATRYELDYLILCYMRKDADDNETPPQTKLNLVWAAIDLAFASLQGQPLRLEVPNSDPAIAFINGMCKMDPGILDDQMVLEIPLKVISGV